MGLYPLASISKTNDEKYASGQSSFYQNRLFAKIFDFERGSWVIIIIIIMRIKDKSSKIEEWTM